MNLWQPSRSTGRLNDAGTDEEVPCCRHYRNRRTVAPSSSLLQIRRSAGIPSLKLLAPFCCFPGSFEYGFWYPGSLGFTL